MIVVFIINDNIVDFISNNQFNLHSESNIIAFCSKNSASDKMAAVVNFSYTNQQIFQVIYLHVLVELSHQS